MIVRRLSKKLKGLVSMHQLIIDEALIDTKKIKNKRLGIDVESAS